MGEEFVKILGPWPILQVIFGLLVFGVGAWAVFRGVTGKEDRADPDDQRELWEAYNQLRSIELNLAELVKSNQKILEAVQHLTSIIWNRRSGI